MSTVYGEDSGKDNHQYSARQKLQPRSNGTRAISVIFSFTHRAHLPLLAICFTLSALAGTIQPVTSILVGKLMNSLSRYAANDIDGDEFEANTKPWLISLAMLGTAACFLRGSFCCAWIVFGESQARVVREDLFSSLVIRDFEWFEAQSSGVSSLLSRIQVQIREFQLSVSQPFGITIMTIFQSLFSLGVGFYYNWRLTLVLLAAFSLIALTLTLLNGGLQTAIEDQQKEMANAAKQASHVTTNITILKCYNGIPKEANHYNQILLAVSQHYRRQAWIAAKQIAFMRVAASAVIVIALTYGAYLIHNVGANPGEILSTFWCCGTATRGFNDILSQMLVLEKGRASVISLNDLIRRVKKGKKLARPCSGRTPRTLRGDIDFRNVSFAYPSNPDRLVLDRLTLSFPAHQTTFIVGASGSGKSTISQLLLNLYTPEHGRITVDGRSLKNLDTNWLRNNVTIVQQDSILFNETLSVNIALGHRDPNQLIEQQIRVGADFAMLAETLRSLPEGINTMVGRGGCNLSGGQRQRVALARARVRDSPILVLDESTSALDHSTKGLLMNNIREWRRGRTTIIITHDLSQIEQHDFMYVLRDGVVVAKGTRSNVDLLATQPSDIETVATTRISAPTLDKSFHLTRSQSSLSKHSNMSTDSFESGLSQSTVGETANLLRAVSSNCLVKNDRGKTFRAMLRDKDRPFPRKSPEISRVADEAKDLGILDQNYEMAKIAKSGVLRNRLTMTQAARPYSTLPALTTRSVYQDQDARIGVPLEEIDISLPLEHNTTRVTIPVHLETVTTQSNKKTSLRMILLTIWPFLQRAERLRLSLALTAAVIYGGIPSVSSWITVHLFQAFYLPAHWVEQSRKWALILTAVAFGEAAAAFSIHFLFETLAQAWINSMRLRAFTTITSQPKSWFDDESRSTTELCTTLDRAAEEMRYILGRFVPFVLIFLIMVSISTVWCFIACWKLALVGLAFAPLVYVVSKVFQITSTFWESRTSDASEIVSDVFSESFVDVRTVRALTLESHFHKKYMTVTLQCFIVGLKRAILIGMCFGVSGSITPFVIAGIFRYATTMARSQEFSTQNILTVLSLLVFTMISAGSVLAFIPQTSSSVESGSRLLQLISLSSIPGESDEQLKLKFRKEQFDGTVEFCGLTFAYPSRPEVSVLSNLKLVIESGRCIVIVGASGSGKSTILSLILGLYTPQEAAGRASLRISGHDIKEHDIQSLRSHIAYVPQRPTLFPTTVRENVLYGLEARSSMAEDRMHAAAKAAGIHEFITCLPEEYNTVIGDGGLNVSGGQAQRISVARALVLEPRILLMDEPTSALDDESANGIRNTIRAYKNRSSKERPTIIIVTHSEDMMRLADKVVVVEAGHVVEEGAYINLMHCRGKLWRLVRGRENSTE